MGANKNVVLIDGFNKIDTVDVICAFEIPGLFGKFIIYTKDEKDRDGNTIIYAGKIFMMNGKQFIENVDEGIEWEKLKTVLKSISRYSLEGDNYV